MAAPYRIRRSGTGVAQVTAAQGERFNTYLDKLMKMIPAEVIGLYLVGSGFIKPGENALLVAWSSICVLAVVVVKAYGTADRQEAKRPDWVHVSISTSAFIIWLFTLGGPFAAFGISNPRLGSLLVLVFTFFVPYIYKGPK